MTLRPTHALALLAALAFPAAALAGGTRIWELAGFTELDRGELRQTTVSSRGEVTLGWQARKLDLEDVGLVWSAAAPAKGPVLLGTGYDGKIFRVDGGKGVLIATTGQLVVTALALDAKGDLYAATLPDAVIWKVPAPAKIPAGKPVAAEKWATLPKEVQHVWALEFDADGRTLYAGTGPEGQLLAIGRDGKATVYLDTDEEHVLAVVRGAGGGLLVGTSPGALLLQVSGPGRSTALADFDATEVKAIAVHEQATVVAVNKFKIAPAIPTKPPTGADGPAGSKSTKPATVGEGQLHRIHADGRQEQLWSDDKAHVVSLAVDRGGTVYAGLGVDGKVISVDRARLLRTELDLDERQVLALAAADGLTFAATGDAGAAYAVAAARPGEAFYLTPALDANASARFGRLHWFGDGQLKVQARTGNTLEPDRSWSDWSKPLKAGQLVPSPAGRYLQLRFGWGGDAKAVLRSVELAYRPLNLRAVITDLDPDSPFHDKSKKGTTSKSTKKGAPQVSERTIKAQPAGEHKAELKLSWKVDNPDDDTLRFRLWYRATGTRLWRPILRDDQLLTAPRYTWKTENVPEGRYQIKLIADDSPSNDPAEALDDEFVSVPVLVDNHQPRVGSLAFGKGRVSGKASDSFSAISALEYAVDGGPWLPIFSKDGVFDEPDEEFDFAPAGKLPPGPHAVAVRAYDRAGNMGTAELLVDIK